MGHYPDIYLVAQLLMIVWQMFCELARTDPSAHLTVQQESEVMAIGHLASLLLMYHSIRQSIC